MCRLHLLIAVFRLWDAISPRHSRANTEEAAQYAAATAKWLFDRVSLVQQQDAPADGSTTDWWGTILINMAATLGTWATTIPTRQGTRAVAACQGRIVSLLRMDGGWQF